MVLKLGSVGTGSSGQFEVLRKIMDPIRETEYGDRGKTRNCTQFMRSFVLRTSHISIQCLGYILTMEEQDSQEAV